MNKTLLIFGLLMFHSFVLAKQYSTGSLYGTITIEDSLGKSKDEVASECIITAINEDTNKQKQVKVYKDGSFKIPSLKFGNYSIKTQCERYDDASIKNLKIMSSKRIDASMSVVLQDTVYIEPHILPSCGSQQLLDMESSEPYTFFSEETIDRLPVARNFTALTLLAPGAVLGDSAFGNLSSIHGASVAENSYYIDGMEVTNFRNGLGSNSAPFEFYRSINITTGGFGAEYGHATGAVIEAETKSGGDEWKFAVSADYAPNSFRKSNYDVYRQDGTLFAENIHNEADELNVYLEASGPLIQKKLFVYALYNPRQINLVNIKGGGTELLDFENDDAFWGTKIDWNINEKHKLELTAFSDKQTSKKNRHRYYRESHTRSDSIYEKGREKSGGENYLLKYSGDLSTDFSLSILLGQNKYNRSDGVVGDDVPVIIDSRAGIITPPFCCNITQINKKDKGKEFNIDAHYYINYQHNLKFGIHNQNNSSLDLQTYQGGVYYRYYDATPGDTIQGGIVPDGVTEVSRQRIFENGGTFDVINTAFYLEDNWSISDDFSLNIGIRNESFENKDANGETFIKVKNEWAPRISGTWNIDNKSKLYFNAGRYYLPIPSTTNIKLAGAELFTQAYYVLEGTNSDLTPIHGEQIGSLVMFGNGLIPEANSYRDLNIKPTHQDEIIFGYEKQIDDSAKAGVRYIYRQLDNAIENVTIDRAVIDWAGDQLTIDGETAAQTWTGFHQYVLTNPGQDMRIFLPEYNQFVDFTADLLGYPKATRKYNALEFYFDKYWDGQFMLQGSYVYSIGKGNYEGWVSSDSIHRINHSSYVSTNDQAGLTLRFDQPGLTDGSYGLLPNDRTHVFKIFGAWEFTNNWQLGFNALMTSGRPINAFGVHPSDYFVAEYGAQSFYQNEEIVPRGSRGRTPFISHLDLSLSYKHNFAWKNATALFKVDIYNLFDAHNITEIIETAERETRIGDPNYLLPTGFQQPQYLMFSAHFAF